MITLLNKFDDEYKINEKDILDIAWSYIKENRLEDILKDVKFDPTSIYLGFYNDKSNTIVFNDERIQIKVKELYNELLTRYQIDEKYLTYFWNFFYLFITFHDVEHINQIAKYNRRESELYNYLYDVCNTIKEKDYDLYISKHDLFPINIEVDNASYLHAYNLMAHTKLPNIELKLMYLEYIKSLLKNYEKYDDKIVISPVDKLAMLTSEIDLDNITRLLNETRLSKIDRMNLGLSITPSEYDSIIKTEEKEKRKMLK